MPAADALAVPGHLNGPRESGNGGFSCGTFARLVDGPARVSLRRPVPLDTELRAVPAEGGARVLDGEELIATVEPAEELGVEVPDPVGLEEAREAGTRYRGVTGGPFSSCFVCGLEREDAFGVMAGEVEGRSLVASPWTPREDAASDGENVDDEFVWAVLDCPAYFAAYLGEELEISVLARQQAEVGRRPRVGEELVVASWPVSVDGRKRLAGGAIFDGDGNVLARSEALMVALAG